MIIFIDDTGLPKLADLFLMENKIHLEVDGKTIILDISKIDLIRIGR